MEKKARLGPASVQGMASLILLKSFTAPLEGSGENLALTLCLPALLRATGASLAGGLYALRDLPSAVSGKTITDHCGPAH